MNSLNMMVAIPPRDACPRFNPEGWDEQELHFKDKPFVRVTTRSIFHIPINMGRIFSRTHKVLEKENAVDKDQLIVLSRDISPWKSEHFFAVNKEVQEQEMANLSVIILPAYLKGPIKMLQNGINLCKSILRKAVGVRKISTYFIPPVQNAQNTMVKII